MSKPDAVRDGRDLMQQDGQEWPEPCNNCGMVDDPSCERFCYPPSAEAWTREMVGLAPEGSRVRELADIALGPAHPNFRYQYQRTGEDAV